MNLLLNPACMRQHNHTPPPLGFLYMAALEGNTEVYDEAIRPALKLNRLRPRVVGVPVYTRHRHASLDRLRAAKKCGAVTVAGGPHVATMLDQMVEHYGHFIDHFVVGDGELAWKAICEGQKMPQVIRMRVEDLDTLPLPAWNLIDYRQYPGGAAEGRGGCDLTQHPRVSIVLSRGCTGHCAFCSAHWVNGKPRSHGKEWMRKHLTLLWNMGVRHLVFWDDSLTMDRRAAMDLFDVLDQFTFSWCGTARTDEMDEELALRMAQVGCFQLSFGIESGSQTILDKMNKKCTPADAFRALEACRKANIRFGALMIDGYPYNTPETEREDREFRHRFHAKFGSVGHTMVFPGTALYQDCKRAGLISDEFWLGKKTYYVYQGGLDG